MRRGGGSMVLPRDKEASVGPHWRHCIHQLGAFVLSLAGSAATASEVLQPGVNMLYKDGSGRVWCVTVVSLGTWVDGEHWAWFTINDDVRRVGHVPVKELGQRCRPRAANPS
jgi:hypothetical protein